MVQFLSHCDALRGDSKYAEPQARRCSPNWTSAADWLCILCGTALVITAQHRTTSGLYLVDNDVRAAGLLQAADGLAATADDAADDARRALHGLRHVTGARTAGLAHEVVDLRHRGGHLLRRRARDRHMLQVARRRVVDL